MRSLPKLPLLTLLVASALSLHAQEPDPSLYDGLEYRSVGPTRGGRSTAVAGVAGEPFTFYMGTTGGGVWETTDAGTSWNNISDKDFKAGSIGAITVAPSDVNVIYVGTGSACARGNVSPGIGIYKSMDKGKTWEHSGLSEAGQVGKIEVHPRNPDLVYVAALGNVFGSNNQRGIFRSSDGGKSWDKVLYVSDSTGAIDLAMDPKNPRIIYAAMWRAERKPWTLIDGGMQGGIWKTKDGGDTWKKLEGGLPTGVVGRIGLTLSPSNPSRVWALIQTKIESDGGLYRSENGGETWTKVNRHHKLRQRGWYYTHITADPRDENVIYASNTGFYKSIDGGKTFDRIWTPHGDNHGVWINPDNTDIMINCNDGGANVSLNGGDSWSTQYNQPTSEFYRVSVDNQFPFRVYAGQQDNTTISVPSSYRPALTPFQHWSSAGGAESGDVAVDPRNPNVMYAGAYSGEITYMDLSKDYIQERTAYPHYTEGTEQRDLKYRWQWNFPITINPFNPDEIFHTSNVVMKSTDQGATWEVISPDLTRAIDEYHDIPGGPVQHDGTGVEIYSTIFAFELSSIEQGLMWAGSDDGMVHISRDNGSTWQDVTPSAIPLEGTVNKIYPSVHDAAVAYIAVYNYRYKDFSPYILKTSDYGKNWDLLSDGKNGIPDDHFTRVVIEDNKVKGLLYAGTEFGMYVSFNDGKSWKSLQLNLPVVPITDAEWIDNSLALSTQGRSFWILDDLGPLQQAKEADAGMPFIFKPKTAYRTNVGGKGLRIFYYLAEETELKIKVLKGEEVVKSFSSDPTEGESKIEPEIGLNSLYWNLRTTGPEIVPDFVSMVMGNREQGPYIPPGKYIISFDISGENESVDFTVEKDPRWDHLAQEDFDQQWQLAREIMATIQESQDLIRELRSIREQVDDISKRTEKAGYSKELVEQAKSLSKSLTEVEGEIIQNKIETSQDAINYPRKFSNHIGRLYGVLVRYHGPPTGGVLDRWMDVKMEHEVNLKAFNDLKSGKLTQFLDLLASEKVTPIIMGKN